MPTGSGIVSTVKPALDAPHDGLAVDFVTDEERITQCGRRIVGEKNVWHRRAGGRGGGLCVGFEFHAGVHIVGRAGAQDQRTALPVGDGLDAHVVRLAPPVNARRLSTEVRAPKAVCSTAASLVPSSALSTITSCRI